MPDPMPHLPPLATAARAATLPPRCEDCAEDIITQDGQRACDWCVRHAHSRCGNCGEWYRLVCRNCVACDCCYTVVSVDETVETANEQSICETCREEEYSQCEECAAWTRIGEVCDCDDTDDCDCGLCRNDDTPHGTVHSYDYKPVPLYCGNGPLYLGAEIEVETDDYTGCVDIATSRLGELGYLKADGSLDGGFEIVTHPMSYPWAMQHFPWPMLTELGRAGCKVTANTGLHVHISRAGFASPCHTYRWMKFIYRNQVPITRLAGRSSPQWAAFTRDNRGLVKDYAKGCRSESRYQAINPNNLDTFELRIFASSLRPATVQAALGFAAASVEYTRPLSAATILHHGGWEWQAFTAWLTRQPEYRPLRRRLEELQCVC